MNLTLHPLEYTQRELPRVCAVTGEPADWQLTMEASRPASPLALLLFFLGPIGWLLLLAVVVRGGPSTQVDVPVSQEVMDRLREHRRRLWILFATLAAATVGFGIGASNQMFPTAWLVFVPPIAIGFWTGQARPHRLRLSLDGAGLVTIRNVHPTFVTAVAFWREASPRTTPQP
jgi:hypothetical protein